jgi:hypothetical protein
VLVQDFKYLSAIYIGGDVEETYAKRGGIIYARAARRTIIPEDAVTISIAPLNILLLAAPKAMMADTYTSSYRLALVANIAILAKIITTTAIAACFGQKAGIASRACICALPREKITGANDSRVGDCKGYCWKQRQKKCTVHFGW